MLRQLIEQLNIKILIFSVGLATGADVVPDQFGQVQQGGLKDKIATLLQAVRILMRSTYSHLSIYRADTDLLWQYR